MWMFAKAQPFAHLTYIPQETIYDKACDEVGKKDIH